MYTTSKVPARDVRTPTFKQLIQVSNRSHSALLAPRIDTDTLRACAEANVARLREENRHLGRVVTGHKLHIKVKELLIIRNHFSLETLLVTAYLILL